MRVCLSSKEKLNFLLKESQFVFESQIPPLLQSSAAESSPQTGLSKDIQRLALVGFEARKKGKDKNLLALFAQ